MVMTIGDWAAGAITRWDAGTIERFEDWTAGVEMVDYHQDEEGAGIYFIDRQDPATTGFRIERG
jgi:hypothetical protein